jgi:hypothetical protein
MRTTVNLSEPVLKSARRRAAERGVTLSALLEDALRIYTAQNPSGRSTPFRLHTVAGKLVNPELDLDRTSALDALDDELGFAARRRK